MKTLATLGLSLLTLATVGLAPAQDPAPQPAKDDAPRRSRAHHGLLAADLDEDGHVTQEEFRQHHESLFKKADGNADGQLDRDEVLSLSRLHRERGGAIPPAPGPEWRADRKSGRFAKGDPERFFSTLDANDDGKLQRDELPEGLAAHFERIDADADGAVSPEEMKQARPDRENMRARFHERIKDLDANADGLIQRDEASAPLERFFDKLDANADGAIDAEEMKNFRPRGERREGKRPRGAEPSEAPAPADGASEKPAPTGVRVLEN